MIEYIIHRTISCKDSGSCLSPAQLHHQFEKDDNMIEYIIYHTISCKDSGSCLSPAQLHRHLEEDDHMSTDA